MRFQFRYERLLSYREEMEKKALVEAARVESRRDHELRGLSLLRGEAKKLGKQWHELVGRSTPMDEVYLIHSRWAAVQSDLERQRTVVEEWEARLAEARERWIEARRAKKVFLLLKEKALARFVAAVNKAEIEHSDEVSLRPYVGEAIRGQRG
jgi:flagellar export protein FliJ